MSTPKYIKDKRGNTLYPITLEEAVVDSNNVSLDTKLASISNDIASKQAIVEDINTIREGAALGSTAYQKPTTGIPKEDLEASIRTMLANVVLYGDEVGTV